VAGKQTMKAGFARRAINAPVGTVMDGPRMSGGTTGCHDDLFVRTLWLEQGKRRIALVAYDLIYTERAGVDGLKGAISRCFGLKADEVLINFSHTHAPPAYCHWAYGNVPDPLYVEKVEALTIEALAEARGRLKPARLVAGQTTTRVPLSRRRPNGQGKIEFRPYEEGEVCAALPFFLVKTGRGRVLSVVFSVSCHPSIIHLHDTSADFPGAACAALNKHFKTEGALFLQGTGGDAKPRQIWSDGDKWKQGDWADVEAAGQEIARAVIAAADQAQPIEPDLRVGLVDVEMPFGKRPSRDDLQAVTEPRIRKSWAEEMLRRLDFSGTLPASAPVALHAVQLAKNLRLIGLEAEATSAIGNLILRHFPKGVTFPMGYTNGTQFYLPDDRQLAEGGYESESCWEYHWPANLAPGIDARLSTAIQALCPREEGIR
jgi:neutral ceramidase